MINKAIFLDRDGVINEDTGYTHLIEDMRIYPDVCPALSILRQNFFLIIITNQSGIGRGMYTVGDFQTFQRELKKRMFLNGAGVDATYFCPHSPEDGCTCRKPSPEMVFRGASDFGIDLSKSVMIGDKASDMACGKAAGCKTIFMSRDAGYVDIPESDSVIRTLWELIT